MTRRCSHCTLSIETDAPWKAFSVADQYMAWLAGYCTPMCQRNAALQAVANSAAWWQRSGK